MLFRDRRHAGQILAGKLTAFRDLPDLLVLALPRGGVPVADEVARALHAPLDVFLVRKLGVPEQPELAMGAIATGGVVVFNHDVVNGLGIPREAIDAVVAREEEELERREQAYRDDRPPPNVRDHTIILVDDGLATGSSMRAAVAALKHSEPREIVVAVPVGAAETCASLAGSVARVVCAETPEPFRAVGLWYADFSQTSDEEVHDLLEAGPSRHPAQLP